MDSRPVGLDRRNPPPEETRRGVSILEEILEDSRFLREAEAQSQAFDQQRRRDFARTVWLCCVLAMGLVATIVLLGAP